MDSLKEINWKEKQKELESSLSDRFKKVWISYSRLGSVCITVFPHGVNSQYRIFTRKNVTDWSVENLKSIVQ